MSTAEITSSVPPISTAGAMSAQAPPTTAPSTKPMPTMQSATASEVSRVTPAIHATPAHRSRVPITAGPSIRRRRHGGGSLPLGPRGSSPPRYGGVRPVAAPPASAAEPGAAAPGGRGGGGAGAGPGEAPDEPQALHAHAADVG